MAFNPRRFWRSKAFKSVIRLILVLWAVSALSFALVAASPIDPVRAYVGEVGEANLNPEMMAKFRAYFGTDVPPLKRYANWLSGAVRGDLGQSLVFRQPVMEVVGDRFMNSLALMLAAWALSGIIAFGLGLLAGIFRESAWDKAIRTYSLVLASAPTFWLALIALMIFAVKLKWLPIGLSAPIGKSAADVTILDNIRHLVLPALTLSVTSIAAITLHTREKVVDVMEEDFILYARSRGESLPGIVKKHALRNVALPAITLQFASFSEIFGGSVLVEQVFSYPGLGQAAVLAGMRGDSPLLLGIAVISAFLVFAGNFIANILYGLIDPKIRRGEG
ncbi:MAG: ABC transporter permease [Deltaproteobacteria bacterium]|jgi:peptide/nickel transport system permease protein|nr:ABC transporter permease [Deltaproteobacteria bacterium]